MPADATDFKWYQYTADDASTWSMKVDKTWGDDAASGFGAASDADPVMPNNPAIRARYIELQDKTGSGRITRRYVGGPAASAWTTSGFTTTIKYKGLATGVVVTKVNQRGEHFRRSRLIDNKPEPV